MSKSELSSNDTYRKYADELLTNSVSAFRQYITFDQKTVDGIVHETFKAAYDHRLDFARRTLDETNLGIFEHKVAKNIWASLLVYENIKNQKTVGAIRHDPIMGITEIAQPHGPILALTPLTNPTSTIIFKTLIALKTRNPLIFSPHGSSRSCSLYAAEILSRAAVNAGAPEYSLQWLTKKHPAYLWHIMRHRSLSLIIATGTRQIVKEAYSSGKPVIGIGPGNVPVYVDRTADLELASEYIVLSKTFDNGTVCASEQALVVERSVAKDLKPLMEEKGCYFCSKKEAEKLGQIAFDSSHNLMRADVVGKPASFLAEISGLCIPEGTRLLVAPCAGVGKGYPLSYEILTPILAYYEVDSHKEALEKCIMLNQLGGQGHTISIYANDDDIIREFTSRISAGRICVNTPATQGAIGGIYNTLTPSFTLSCGTQAGNIFTDNITTTHLLNIHRVARRRLNNRWFDIPEEMWLDPDINSEKMEGLFNKNY